MAAEYLEIDKQGLIRLAVLLQDFWVARSARDRLRLAPEIRHHEEKFGLDPVSRRRLQWEIGRGEEAAAKTKARRKRKKAHAKDPRDALKILT